MGCKASKQNQVLLPIDCNFPFTGHSQSDEFFRRACQLLQKIEVLRHQIYTTKQQGTLLAGTSHVVDSPYNRAVQVLFWALSAAKQGRIALTGLVISNQTPFLKVITDGLCRETVELTNTLKEYLEILTETSLSLRNLVEQIQRIKEEQTEIKKNLDPKLPSKVTKAIDENMRKLNEGMAIGAKVLSQIPDEQTNALDIINFMEVIFGTSDEIGAKAAAAKLVKPIEISKWVELQNRKNRGASVDKNKKNTKKGKEEMNQKKENEVPANGTVNPSDIIFMNNERPRVYASKTYEHQGSIRGHNGVIGVNQNELKESLSFGDAKSGVGQGQYVHSLTTPVEVISENKLEHLEREKSQQARQKWLTENQSIEAGMMSLNDSHNHSQASFLQQAGQERLLKKPGNQPAKGHFYVREKELEVVIREQPQLWERTKSPGYLSPGGSKQAGILQAEENIIDDQEMIHGLANESVMIKKFIEKAQGYLDMKD